MPITKASQIERYYRALVERDSQYAGAFFVGVKTTGIFCISVCRARKPKRENVEFYADARGALLAGYRPCKICRPTENSQEPPAEVRELLREVSTDPTNRITDGELRKRGLHPARIRRWFKTHHGMTFQGYQRLLRINGAYRQLSEGDRVTDAAFDAGYESLSGFGYGVKSATGLSPEAMARKRVINLIRLTTPLGPMYAAATERGVCLLEFTDRRMLETEFADLARRLDALFLRGSNPHLEQLRTELTEYFSGLRRTFTVALDTPGTVFQQAVWEELRRIPYGTTRTYGDQAAALGKPRAVRAVARANGMNRVAIVIPCHRVIGADGKLVGYAGGLARKEWLLRHEGG